MLLTFPNGQQICNDADLQILLIYEAISTKSPTFAYLTWPTASIGQIPSLDFIAIHHCDKAGELISDGVSTGKFPICPQWHCFCVTYLFAHAAMAHELQVLPPGAGYGIVIGIGGVFALFMLCLTWLQNRYTTFSTHQAEEFNTASRSVKPGLISAGIVSSWTWSATLLTSSTFAYSYGVCGPMWYGAMGTLQILLFGMIAIKIKANAPGAHTMPEIVLSRHGKVAHITYLCYGLATNMLVGAILVLGGAQVVQALTGMNVYAANFLIPLVVAAYVITGGLRSTFIADYTHTVILFIAILVFGFLVNATSDLVGSPGRLYDLLLEASEQMPIARNTDGSYLAFHSVNGLIFAFDILISGFSTVWLDQAYWQRAIASRPETSVKAYILGGAAWYGGYFL